MTGEYYPMPGFCPGLRIKDYSCFIWTKLLDLETTGGGGFDNFDMGMLPLL